MCSCCGNSVAIETCVLKGDSWRLAIGANVNSFPVSSWEIFPFSPEVVIKSGASLSFGSAREPYEDGLSSFCPTGFISHSFVVCLG